MTRPNAGLPRVHDAPPGPFTGVPVERDPLTGKLLPGDALGRPDKGRTARGRHPAAVAAAVIAAVTVGVLVVGGDEEAPAAAAMATGESAAPEPPAPPTPEPPVDPGPRVVQVDQVLVAWAVPPGYEGRHPAVSVGDVDRSTWTLTGPCDGTGPCTLVTCPVETGECTDPVSYEASAGAYVSVDIWPVTWSSNSCPPVELTTTFSFTVTGPPTAPLVTGSVTQSAPQVVVTGSNGLDECALGLGEWTLTSV